MFSRGRERVHWEQMVNLQKSLFSRKMAKKILVSGKDAVV